MTKPASSASRRRSRWTKASYGVRRSASSKCSMTTTSTPARPSRSRRSAGSIRSGGAWPTRTASGCASNVITAGRALRSRASRTEVARAARRGRRWRPSNTPIETRSRPVVAASSGGAPRRPSGRSWRRSPRPDSISTLSGASFVPAEPGDRDEPAGIVDEPERHVLGEQPSVPGGHADRLAPADRGERAVRARRRSAARARRRSDGAAPASASGRSAAAARTASRSTASSSVNGPLAVRVSAPRYAALPTASPRSRASDRTYVPGRALDVDDRDRLAGGRGRPSRDELDARRSSPFAAASSTASPARAIAYARRPATLIAL